MKAGIKKRILKKEEVYDLEVNNHGGFVTRYFVVAVLNIPNPLKHRGLPDDLFRLAYPVGTIVDFAYGTKTDKQMEKKGFLPCKGQRLDAEKWPDLARVLGKHGEVVVPDLRVYIREEK